MSFKRISVVMLPTNEKASIGMLTLGKNTNYLGILTPKWVEHLNSNRADGTLINQHLYFLSSEEIKKGDWFIRNNKIHQCFKSHETDIEFKTNKDSDYRDWETDRKSTRLNSSHSRASRMPSSA